MVTEARTIVVLEDVGCAPFLTLMFPNGLKYSSEPDLLYQLWRTIKTKRAAKLIDALTISVRGSEKHTRENSLCCGVFKVTFDGLHFNI